MKWTCDNFKIGTFNLSVRGLQSEIRQNQLADDVNNYKIDVLCIQETKIVDGLDINLSSGRLICLKSDSRYYGNGFLINNRWSDKIHRCWRVSDRISVIRFNLESGNENGSNITPSHHNLESDNENRNNFTSCYYNSESGNENGKNTTSRPRNRPSFLTIINVYAPHSKLSYTNPEGTDKFYKQLQDTINKENNKTFLILAGDFNSKVGKYKLGEECLGKYSKGTRNENGTRLIDFCDTNNFFITNSAFPHPSRHQTTWTGYKRNKETGDTVPYYNQIDFIVCRQRYKHFATNARSYSGTILTSDHNLVITNFVFEWQKTWRNRRKVPTPKLNVSRLANDTDCRDEYQRVLDTNLNDLVNGKNTPTQKWKCVKSAIQSTAKQTVGVINTKKPNRTPDPLISQLSSKQKDLRIRFNNCSDQTEKSKLKQERNKVLHEIRKHVVKTRNNELDSKAESINNADCDNVMFKAIKALNAKKYENPQVEDNDRKIITNPNTILETVANHFKDKFSDDDALKIPPFSGTPRPLNNPISSGEIRKSLDRLNNNKAPGEDEIHSEFLKYGTPLLDELIAKTINESFEKHEDIEINTGVLIALQKPGKPKGPPKNLRPITLLNTLRKALSIVILNRIRPKIEQYLSPNQSGFRPERSTADVVWAHKWLAAKTTRENITVKVTGIDLSSAFDTINRQKLLSILRTIVNEDEVRIIQYLLSNTVLDTKICGAEVNVPFVSNVGTPQGDGLSPVLFTVYLEHALREVRTITNNKNAPIDDFIPREIIYADDIDFIGSEYVDVDEIQTILQNYQLVVNVEKTEYTAINKETQDWRSTKKVGSLIGDAQDVERRKQLSNVALSKLKSLWIRQDKIKRTTRIKLYRALVKSILTYNCSTWALTQGELKKLDAFHRKQLRKVLNIYYPTKISNKSLYKICNEKPLSTLVTESHWRLFGHILRRDTDIPANTSMNFYFRKFGPQFKGRPITTLPIILNKELSLHDPKLSVKTHQDLEHLRTLAQDRKEWSKLTRAIVKKAEATFSDDQDAEGH